MNFLGQKFAQEALSKVASNPAAQAAAKNAAKNALKDPRAREVVNTNPDSFPQPEELQLTVLIVADDGAQT
jgi:hypothetical protein